MAPMKEMVKKGRGCVMAVLVFNIYTDGVASVRALWEEMVPSGLVERSALGK